MFNAEEAISKLEDGNILEVNTKEITMDNLSDILERLSPDCGSFILSHGAFNYLLNIQDMWIDMYHPDYFDPSVPDYDDFTEKDFNALFDYFDNGKRDWCGSTVELLWYNNTAGFTQYSSTKLPGYKPYCMVVIKNGRRHNEFGPACIYNNLKMSYWLDGNLLSRTDWILELNRRNDLLIDKLKSNRQQDLGIDNLKQDVHVDVTITLPTNCNQPTVNIKYEYVK